MWEFVFKDETGSMQKTGKGSAVEIFSTVGAFLKTSILSFVLCTKKGKCVTLKIAFFAS